MATVLVLDDDLSSREYLTAILDMLGHSCVGVADGRQALELVYSTPPDLIITEVQMPDTDGFKFLHELRRHAVLADIPALVFTGNPDDVCEQQALACDVFTVLPKPGKPDQLMAAIRSALEDPA